MATSDCSGSGSSFSADGASSRCRVASWCGRHAISRHPLRAAGESGRRRRAGAAGLLRRPESRSGAWVDDRRPGAVRAEAVLLRAAARGRGRALPPRGVARPREARRARGDHAVSPRRWGGCASTSPKCEKLHYRLQKQAWFLDAVEIYCEAVRSLAEDLAERDVTSRGLQGLRDYLADYAASRALHLAGGGDASAQGRARGGAVRGPDPGRAGHGQPLRGRGGLQRRGRADVRQVPAGGGEELPGEAARLRRDEPRRGTDPRPVSPSCTRTCSGRSPTTAPATATTSTPRSAGSTARCSSTSPTWS